MDRGDPLIGGVVDHVFALSMAGDDLSLPPGQHRLAEVLLHTQVHGVDSVWHRCKPHQRTGWFDDHRPSLRRSAVGRDQNVTERGIRSRDGDLHLGRTQVAAGVKALSRHRGLARRVVFGGQRVHVPNREAARELAGRVPRADLDAHAHELPHLEWVGWDEAGAVAGRVGLQLAGVNSAARAPHQHFV